MKSKVETLFALRGDPARAPIPLMMMTARRGQDDALAAWGAGASDYVAKPSPPKDLALRIEGPLARRRFVSGESGLRRSLH